MPPKKQNNIYIYIYLYIYIYIRIKLNVLVTTCLEITLCPSPPPIFFRACYGPDMTILSTTFSNEDIFCFIVIVYLFIWFFFNVGGFGFLGGFFSLCVCVCDNRFLQIISNL